MTTTMDMLPLKLVIIRRPMLIQSFVLTLFISLFFMPIAGFTEQDSPAVNELKQKAQAAFVKGNYAEAAASDEEIARQYPNSQARHYAVQMLGTIYEEHIVDIKKAVKWDREFLKKYADYRQAPFYNDKIASLEKALNQEQAFKTYKAIQFANKGDEFIVKQYEALLKEYPDFLLKADVERELAYAYARMDKRKQSAQEFEALSKTEGNKLSTSDQIALRTANRYWQMTWVWAWLAWAVIVILWTAVLIMKPWKQLTWASTRKFLLWPVLWVVLVCASLPTFYSIETSGYPIVIPDTMVFIAAVLNLIILFWLLLLTRAELWHTRRRTLIWLSPVLTVLMTTAVFYLFVVYQPNGPFITDVFAVKWQYLSGELREHGRFLSVIH